MSNSITKTDYPILFAENTDGSTYFTLLSYAGITTVNNLTVSNGSIGSTTASITGSYTLANGINYGIGGTLTTFGQEELQNLYDSIYNFKNVSTPTYNGGPFTFSSSPSGNTYLYTTTSNVSGTLTFNGSGSGTDQIFIISDFTITFEDVTFELNGISADNIFWLAKSDISFFVTNGNPLYGNFLAYSAVTLTTSSNCSITGSMLVTNGPITFGGSRLVTINSPTVCYLKGSNILTESGYKKIEELKVGEKVVTKGEIHNNEFYNPNAEYSFSPIKWIGNFTAPNLNKDTLPICIKANAFQENQPFEDLYVSPGHRILIDGKLICARDLVNGNTIYQDFNQISLEYYHFEVETHSSVIANGVLTETFLDLHNYTTFINNTQISSICLPEPILT